MNQMNHEEFMALKTPGPDGPGELTFSYERITGRHADHEGFGADASHWKVIFTRNGVEFSCEYSMGSAHKHDPKATDVLYGLQIDCGVTAYDTFEDWAADYDRDPDSRAAERIFKSCQATAVGMRAILGDDLFETFMDLEEE